jgi:tRNA G10  N-methylase Trm11
MCIRDRDNQTLNAAEIKGNKLIGKGREYLLSGADVFATLAIQDIDSQVERDFGKPRSNAVSGMVPPKLARMMVNLAASAAPVQSQKSKVQSVTSGLGTWDSGLVTVDPFCGSGNILLEAYDLGYQVQGSDISGGEVQKTTENLNWLANLKRPTENGQRVTTIFQADATKDNFLKGLDPSQIVIVTEPYLGKPHKDKLTMAEAEAEIGPLLNLYQDFLGNCRRLKVKTMCLIFPSFTLTSGKSLGLYARIVDKLALLGYSTFVGSFEYGRDYQIVKREILLLKQKEDTSIK